MLSSENLFASHSYLANSNSSTLRFSVRFSHGEKKVSYEGLAPHLLALGPSTGSYHRRALITVRTKRDASCMWPPAVWRNGGPSLTSPSTVSRWLCSLSPLTPGHQLVATHTGHTWTSGKQGSDKVCWDDHPQNCCDVPTALGPTTQTTPSSVIIPKCRHEKTVLRDFPVIVQSQSKGRGARPVLYLIIPWS